MRLLLRAASIVSLQFTLLLMIFILIGRTQPTPARIDQLHLRDCDAPCWVGITPGQTSAETVNVNLMDTFNSVNSPLSSSVSQFTWFTIVPLTYPARRGEGIPIQFGVSDEIVTEILMPAYFGSTPDSQMPLLGDVVNLLGEPTCVDAKPLTLTGWSLIYERESHVIEIGLLGQERLSWSQPVYFLSIRSNDLSSRVNGCHVENTIFPAWAGLMNRQHYVQQVS
jgi:hypothetical protein